MISAADQTTDLGLRVGRYKAAQVIILSGLSSAHFFDHAAFYGGTCLRIFHGVDRFSEDMKFTLLEPDPDFSFEPYLKKIYDEFALVGRQVEIKQRKSRGGVGHDSISAGDILTYEVHSLLDKPEKIRIEIVTRPVLHFETELRLSVHPRSFAARCLALPYLFACNAHCLAFCSCGQGYRGADWLDFEWFVRHGVRLSEAFLLAKIKLVNNVDLTLDEFRAKLGERISATRIDDVKSDIESFLINNHTVDHWNKAYFLELARNIEYS